MAFDLINPITNEELELLVNGLIRRETFGPNTNRPLIIIDLSTTNDANLSALRDIPCPVIGIGLPRSQESAAQCDILLETNKKLETIVKNITAKPITAMILVQLLRLSETLPIQDALTAESLAYSTLQTGPEFKQWLNTYNKPKTISNNGKVDLAIKPNKETLHLTFNRPETHNAVDVNMRDALCEALSFASIDPSIERVNLTGKGDTFSTGGEVAEFGSISDPATAYWIRSLRLPAWHLARFTKPLHVHVNGAAIGAGAEIAAFGSHITASPKAWFQLPELKYGLIPGAGGTASLPRRIGRQRTAYMALSMDKINAKTALKWGLVDEIN